jgi:hypothetical protein
VHAFMACVMAWHGMRHGKEGQLRDQDVDSYGFITCRDELRPCGSRAKGSRKFPPLPLKRGGPGFSTRKILEFYTLLLVSFIASSQGGRRQLDRCSFAVLGRSRGPSLQPPQTVCSETVCALQPPIDSV